MKNVNLLPGWYLRRQRERQSLHTRIWLMLALGGVMVGWTMVGRAQLRQLTDERDDLVRQGELVANLAVKLQDKQAEIQRLEHLQLAVRELGKSVPMSRVINQVRNNMTAGMAMSRINVDVRPEPIKGGGFVGDAKNPPRYHDVAHLTVVGVSPDDEKIANLIKGLAANPLFTEISMNYTRTKLLRDYSVREFEIQMQIDLDRLTTEDPTSHEQAQAGEGDHAG